MIGRRVAFAAFASAALTRRPAFSIPPPAGGIAFLLPLVTQRLLLAECSAAATRPEVSWSSLHDLFASAPFTTRSGAVGSLFRDAAERYESSLTYSRELSVDDRKLCFPRRDEDCIKLQMDSDRMYRGILVNSVQSALQEVEFELKFLDDCQRGVADARLRCPAADDREEISGRLRAAGAAFDQYLDLVPARDAATAVNLAAQQNPRWNLVPLETPTPSVERSETPTPSVERSGAPSMCAVAVGSDDCDEGATPSTAALAQFALPTLAAWLISPMMSLVDTAVVGRGATSVELAALGPACMVGDSMADL